jgi:hypothetical protein
MAATLDGIRGGNRSRVRGQIHAAVVILRGGRRQKVHGPGPAQHVGGAVSGAHKRAECRINGSSRFGLRSFRNHQQAALASLRQESHR